MADLLWGLVNGFLAWPVLILHVFGWLEGSPVYNTSRDGGWYQFGFLIGAGSPFIGGSGIKLTLEDNSYSNRW